LIADFTGQRNKSNNAVLLSLSEIDVDSFAYPQRSVLAQVNKTVEICDQIRLGDAIGSLWRSAEKNCRNCHGREEDRTTTPDAS
jgi:hypothetical protein